jgi:hypothetical protein
MRACQDWRWGQFNRERLNAKLRAKRADKTFNIEFMRALLPTRRLEKTPAAYVPNEAHVPVGDC